MAGRRAIDLSLYLVIGPDVTGGRRMDEVVRAAVQGGVTAVQVRRKDGATRAFVEDARALVNLLQPLGTPLMVNDRVDVALAAGAAGVHVGQDDMPIADVRRLVGEKMIVGLSVTSVDEARAVDGSIVDYVGVGPVFATPTKPDAAPALGISGTADVCRVLAVPSVAIGGIHEGNAESVIGAGVGGIAVVSAICGAVDPRLAAERLAGLIRQAERAAVIPTRRSA